MNEPLTMTTERVDDLPLLLAHMQRMGLVRLLDAHFPTHGNRQGVSLGVVSTSWLTHILSQADHRMNRVPPWAQCRLETLRGCSEASLQVRDLGDDRLADVLRHLSDDEGWRAFEQELTGQLVRVYDLHADCVRLDSTTPSSYGAVNEDGLLQLGLSCDHRTDLRNSRSCWPRWIRWACRWPPRCSRANGPMTRCICPPSHGCARA